MMSLPDPTTEAEGGIDPLGIASIADRFATAMVPGVTQRMSRPRFLSLMCAQAAATEDIVAVAPDGTSAEIVFEWLAVQAFAILDDDIRRVAGIAKARAVLRDNAPMTSRAYLKGPKIFGFHGIYKTLGVSLGLFDDDLRLMLNGERLVSALEKSPPMAGLLAGGEATPGGKWRRRMRELVQQGIQDAAIGKPKGVVYDGFVEGLRPDRMTKPEAELLRAWLADPSGGTRGELFALVDHPEVRSRADELHERPFLRSLRPLASPELASHLDAIDGFEAVAKPVQDAFDWIRFLSSRDRMEPVRAASFVAAIPDLVTPLREAVARLPGMTANSKHAREVDGLLLHFGDVRTPEQLFDAVLTRHEMAQKRKPPSGKRSWFERTADGGALVRPLYRIEEPPLFLDVAVHPYRVASILSFLDDLGAAQ